MFSHVPQRILDKCITFDEARNRLAQRQSVIHDIRGPLNDWTARVINSQFVMHNRSTGRDYIPTEHAIGNMCYIGGIPEFFPRMLREPKFHPTKMEQNGSPKKLYDRDSGDADLLVNIFNNSLFRADRTDQQKERLFRTWDNGTLRACLSDQYAIVNNQWVMEQWQQILPQDALITHWRGDADNIYGNVLLPDTIRQDKDSDYGGGLNIGNSEIGVRRVKSCLFVFRSICSNGIIFGLKTRDGISKVHRGELDLKKFALDIQAMAQAQLKLAGNKVDELMKLRQFSVGTTPIINVFAELAKSYSISKAAIRGIIKEFPKEVGLLDKEAYSAFGIVNSMTRYSQTLDDESWVETDNLAGTLTDMSPAKWGNVVASAALMDKKDLEKLVGSDLVVAA